MNEDPMAVQQVANNIKEAKKGWLKPVLFIILLVVLLGGMGYGVYAWRQHKIDDLVASEANYKQLLAAAQANNDQQPATPTAEGNQLVMAAVVAGSTQANAQTQVGDFYKIVLANQENDSACEGFVESYCAAYAKFLSTTATDQLKTKQSASPITCSQQKSQLISVGVPVVTNNTATVKVSILPLGNSIENLVVNQVDMIQQDNGWLINKFTCQTQEG